MGGSAEPPTLIKGARNCRYARLLRDRLGRCAPSNTAPANSACKAVGHLAGRAEPRPHPGAGSGRVWARQGTQSPLASSQSAAGLSDRAAITPPDVTEADPVL